MSNPTVDLQGLLAAALEVLTTFLTASYLASAASEGLSSALSLRARLLMKTIRELLNETHNSAPVTLAIYNNYIFNPRSPPPAETIAAVKSLPSIVDPLTFARALMDALGLRGSDPQPMYDAIRASGLHQDLQRLANGVVARHEDEIRNNDLNNLQSEIAHWFERAVGHSSDDYRRLSQLANFIIGLFLAVLLGLDPLPKSLMANGLLAQIPSEWPIKLVGYVVVAVSTVYGAPFWFSLIMKISPIKPTGISPDAAADPPTGVSRNGDAPADTPPAGQAAPPDQVPPGPALAGPAP